MSRLRRGSPALIRDLNRSAVLALIGSQGPVARVEIARRLSLSAATVTEVTRELVTEGLIRVVDQAASSGGRRPLLLGLVAEAAHALGVKVSPDRIAIVEVNLDGDILTRTETPIDALGPEALGRLVKVLQSAVEAADGSRLLGIGLGVPGTVDAQTGVVNAPILGWNSIELGRALRSAGAEFSGQPPGRPPARLPRVRDAGRARLGRAPGRRGGRDGAGRGRRRL